MRIDPNLRPRQAGAMLATNVADVPAARRLALNPITKGLS